MLFDEFSSLSIVFFTNFGFLILGLSISEIFSTFSVISKKRYLEEIKNEDPRLQMFVSTLFFSLKNRVAISGLLHVLYFLVLVIVIRYNGIDVSAYIKLNPNEGLVVVWFHVVILSVLIFRLITFGYLKELILGDKSNES